MQEQKTARRRGLARLVACVIACAVVWTIPAHVWSRNDAAGAGVQTAVPATPPVWVGHEAAIEEALRTSRVERIEDLKVGVTKPKRAYFAAGGAVASATWKPLKPGIISGYWESYKSEIAAYELDKLLGLQMVPPAVEREIRGEKGAAILWLDDAKEWKKNEPVTGPEPGWSRQASRMKLFDQLIANIDRNSGNLMYDSVWHLLLIDHSRAFTERMSFAGISPVVTVDQVMWDRINGLTRESLGRALQPWLADRAIDAILKRREKMRADIQKNVAKLGEARVFLK